MLLGNIKMIETYIQILPNIDIKKIDNNFYLYKRKCPRCNSKKPISYFNGYKTCMRCLKFLREKRKFEDDKKKIKKYNVDL